IRCKAGRFQLYPAGWQNSPRYPRPGLFWPILQFDGGADWVVRDISTLQTSLSLAVSTYPLYRSFSAADHEIVKADSCQIHPAEYLPEASHGL
ncbi:MAG: hypothetical protein AAGU05_08620, partial [Anaerolineaceae bacterium]